MFLPQNRIEQCDNLHSTMQEKEGGRDSDKADEKKIASIHKLSQYECFTTNRPENISLNLFF